MRTVTMCVLTALVLMAHPAARAQCEPAWESWGSRPVLSGADTATIWDPDGDGPLDELLVVGGNFTREVTGDYLAPMDRIGAFGPEGWRPLGLGLNGDCETLTTWDPDGEGPMHRVVVAGGRFTMAGGVPAASVAAWDGTRWSPLGSGSNEPIFRLLTWDPDGSGPMPEVLLALGGFANEAGQVGRRVMQWDGTSWTPLGPQPSPYQTVVGMVWDPDDDGPEPPQLLVVCALNPGHAIMRWDGRAWQRMGPTISADGFPIRDFASWDPDGSGPERRKLVIVGQFTSIGDRPIAYIAAWDGTAWSPLGEAFDWYLTAVKVWDPDENGPQPAQLVVSGPFTRVGNVFASKVARWDGHAWHPLAEGLSTTQSAAARQIVTYDIDGSGPDHPHLVFCGGFDTAGGLAAPGLARWDGRRWWPFGAGMSRAVRAVATWDPDGPGPRNALLIAAGSFMSNAWGPLNRIASWDGTQWRGLGTGVGVNGQLVECLTTWDPDGSGPQQPQLVAAGEFSVAGGELARNIARWDGTRWWPLGSGLSGRVFDIMSWDPDGDGPAPPQLLAGGWCRMAGETEVNYVASWDGTRWSSLGGGVDSYAVYKGVHSLALWDPDGPGPLGEQVVALGRFLTAGGIPARNIARWDGTRWWPFGEGLGDTPQAPDYSHSPYVIKVWDPDQGGPEPAQLIVGGGGESSQNRTLGAIYTWRNGEWFPLGGLPYTWVRDLTTWDPDGDGPMHPQLVAVGAFMLDGDQTQSNVARWDGRRWSRFGRGLHRMVLSATSWDPDGPGPLAPQLVAGGEFTVRGATGDFLARWIPCPAPCTADFDGDWFVDIRDLDLFLACFDAGVCEGERSADINGDGFLDFFDLDAFLAAFETGC